MKDGSGATPPINWPTLLFILGTSAAALSWPVYAWHYGVTVGEVCARSNVVFKGY